jgi:hypothetical protein
MSFGPFAVDTGAALLSGATITATGFNSFLYKPIETEKLFKCLAENLPQDKIV